MRHILDAAARLRGAFEERKAALRAFQWERAGRVPHARGSRRAKWIAIDRGISDPGAGDYGRRDGGLDERVVEYPWLFDRVRHVHPRGGHVLDAGSVLNHPRLLRRWRAAGFGPLSIVTLAYEGRAELSDDVRYEFADLRQLPYRDRWFSTVVCLSTLEHVAMDNSGYGGDVAIAAEDPTTETTRTLGELARVTAAGGTLLVSVPFGARAGLGWMRVFDADDVRRIETHPAWSPLMTRVFRATAEGWRECALHDAATAGYNESAGRRRRTAPLWVAAAEAVAVLELTRR